jgi:SAM-dependent methyltransferase
VTGLTATIAAVELTDFIVDLRPPPARALEVGCGDGALTTALADRGYDVTGIDPAAPSGDLFRRIKLEDLEETERYDLVVAVRSLHHITDLDGALDKIVRLLRGRGLLVVEEFAWDRLDAATAEWFYGQQPRSERAASVDECRRDWDDEHVGLHGCEALRTAIGVRFDELRFEWRPYLYRLLDSAPAEALERSLIESRAIQPLGFRYSGTPRG